MGFYETFLHGLEKAAREQFKNPSRLAEYLGVEPNLITRWLKRERIPRAEKMGEVLDALGAKLVFPGEGQSTNKEVHFVNAKVVNVEDGAPPIIPDEYLAVPLVSEAGAGPGVVPSNDFESWFLVYKNEPSIRQRSNLIAVRIAKGSTSMVPTLSPNDIVLVDRNERTVHQPGRIWLVMEPDGAGKVKRVKIDYLREHRQTRLTFYSDNVAENPPEVYDLDCDYEGDLHRAIVGRVVWAWSDVSNK